MHFRISYTMNAEDIFRSSIGCEIMLMIKARIRLIFSRYTTVTSLVMAMGKEVLNRENFAGSIKYHSQPLFVLMK